MRLSTKGRYAVMALADLAARAEDKPIALAEIATRQDISLSYLEQLFGRLRRGGLVKSVRGPGGGYLLGRAAIEISVFDVMFSVDEPTVATRCNPESPTGCHGGPGHCPTHHLWEALGNQIGLYLKTVTLEDVVARRVVKARNVYDPNQRVLNFLGDTVAAGEMAE